MTLTTVALHDSLRATVTGRLTLTGALEVARKICDAAAAQGLRKILVDCLGIEGVLSTTERFQFGTELVEYLHARGMSPIVAMVGVPPSADGFAALVLQNRGVEVRVFADLQEAARWLQPTCASTP